MDTETPPINIAERRRTRPNRLREFRVKADITQGELAEIVGASQPAIALAETTGKGLGDAKWQQIADFFEVDLLILRGSKRVFADPEAA